MIRTLLLPFLICAAAFAAGPERNSCSERTRGQFWPPEANTNPHVARDASQRGELFLCTKAVWKFTWQPLSVRVDTPPKTAGEPRKHAHAAPRRIPQS